MAKLDHTIVTLDLLGKLTEMDGEQLHVLFRNFGLDVRLNTEIKVIIHGKRNLSPRKLGNRKHKKPKNDCHPLGQVKSTK